MSDKYLYRLRQVRKEYDAAREAVAFVLKNWYQPGIGDRIDTVTLSTLEETARHVERTYFIRLYAEFEGILKDHLVSNHPARAFAPEERPRIDEVITRVVQAEGLTINPRLRVRLDRARDYRNSIAHSRRVPVPPVSIQDGIAALGKMLDMLPDPRD